VTRAEGPTVVEPDMLTILARVSRISVGTPARVRNPGATRREGGGVADDGPTQVSLVVDGKLVALSELAQRIVTGTVSGVVTMVEDLPEHPDRIELVIRRS
jgi:hypothetical protein